MPHRYLMRASPGAGDAETPHPSPLLPFPDQPGAIHSSFCSRTAWREGQKLTEQRPFFLIPARFSKTSYDFLFKGSVQPPGMEGQDFSTCGHCPGAPHRRPWWRKRLHPRGFAPLCSERGLEDALDKELCCCIFTFSLKTFPLQAFSQLLGGTSGEGFAWLLTTSTETQPAQNCPCRKSH